MGGSVAGGAVLGRKEEETRTTPSHVLPSTLRAMEEVVKNTDASSPEDPIDWSPLWHSKSMAHLLLVNRPTRSVCGFTHDAPHFVILA